MKRGFSLITAIIFIVLIATIGALSLSLSNVSVKQTGDLYLKTQAEFLAISATEYAILAVLAHDINGSCINKINATYPDSVNPVFDINISIAYFGKGLPSSPNCNILDNNVTNIDSNVTLLIDTFVATKDGISTEPIRFHRRTLQKP